LLNISSPPLSMRLPRDALLPHCPSAQLTIALKRRFSCLFCTRTLCTPSGSRATCLRSAFAYERACSKKTEPESLLKYAARYEFMGSCVRLCGRKKTRVDMNVPFIYLP
jgi:hypothetical protein